MKSQLQDASRQLRTGYTTGACAAAAARGAAQMLVQQGKAGDVTITLPAGVFAKFKLYGQEFNEMSASCYVIKNAGDDPDVTNGAEVHAAVWLNSSQTPFAKRANNIIISGGVGIGRVTKPGLAVVPGEWAINPVPRRMIEEAVLPVFSSLTLSASTLTINIVISIPDGEERAKKTLNQRLGIIGGLSILGTTGIVHPVSAKAWTDTIDAAIDVAHACGCGSVVLSTGRTSEMAAMKHLPTFPEETFIMIGDHFAYALESCEKRGFGQIMIACQFAKLLKMACGHKNTHAAASEIELVSLLELSLIHI